MRHLVFAGVLVAPIAAVAQVPTAVNFEAVVSDTTGEPVTGATPIEVELFDAATGGTSLGLAFGATLELDGDGYFVVPLSFAGVDISGGQLFLELVVGGEAIVPRFEVGSVPYALATGPLADGSVRSSQIAAGAVGSSEIATGAVDTSHIASGFGLVPAGTIVMWSGTLASIPVGWGLCDGSQGTPDLRDRFVLSVDTGEDPGATGGAHDLALEANNLPSHDHTLTTDSGGSHSHAINPVIRGMDNTVPQTNDFQLSSPGNGHLGDVSGTQPAGSHAHSGTTDAAGGGQAFDNRPAFYELAFIMKLP
jgi:microcystin-dependent protein